MVGNGPDRHRLRVLGKQRLDWPIIVPIFDVELEPIGFLFGVGGGGDG